MSKNKISSASVTLSDNAIVSTDICVVIPNFNGAPFIRRAIDSVLLNDDLSIQIVVVDDASTDDSIAQIDAFGDRVSLIRFAQNMGPNIARNSGLDACAADFIIFLDSDDYLVSGGLSQGLDEFRKSDADVLFGSFKYASADSEWKRQTAATTELCNGAKTAKKWVSGDWVPPCSVIWKSDFLRRIGGWSIDANRANNQDGELIFRAAVRGGRFLWSPTDIGVYFQHSGPRTSSLQNFDAMKHKYHWLRFLIDEAGHHNAELAQALSIYALNEARICFSLGNQDTGRRFLQLANCAGGRPKGGGTILHVIVTKAIGLERKEKISRLWRLFKASFERTAS